MRLLRAEWSRLFARRFTRVMIVLILLVLAAVGLGVAAQSHRLTAADHAQARAQLAEQQRIFAEQKSECEAARARGDTSDKYPPNCDYGQPNFQERDFLPYQFDLRRDLAAYLLVSAGILAMFGFIVGASSVGAEWTSGGMTNLLLWRPRRLLVLATKLFTLLVGVGLVAVAYVAAWGAAFWAIGRYRGTTGRLTTGLWQSLALTGGRAVALGLVAAAAGFAVASLGRHTAMALGVAVGYALVVEVGSMIVFGLLDLRDPERWRLSTYVLGWLLKRYDLPPSCGRGGCATQGYVVTWQMSAGVLGAVLVVVVALAFLSMRRRDVT